MTTETIKRARRSSPPAAAPVDPAVARRAVRLWTSIIVGLLLLQVGLCGWGVYCALKGKAAVVESDYYNKALHWDEQQSMRRASLQLGWAVDLAVGDTATSRGERALTVTLNDKAGAPIRDAQVEVTYFHHARPMELRQATLKATGGPGAGAGGGLYVSSAPLDRRGIWEFRLTIHHQGQTFVETLQRDLFE